MFVRIPRIMVAIVVLLWGLALTTDTYAKDNALRRRQPRPRPSWPTPTTSAPTLPPNTQAYFPDGLHPNSQGNAIIAASFNDQVNAHPPTNIGANNPNLIVCMGDSITQAGYPSILANMCGKQCINDGIGGTASRHGAERVNSVLTKYKPAYLCILYGANDVIQRISPSVIIANLDYMVKSAKSKQTIPILATLTPMSGSYAGLQPTVMAVNRQIRSLASMRGIPLADLEKEFR